MIDKIVTKLEEANEKYRQGNPIMSDYDYDQLLETLYEYDPENEYFNKVGIEIIDDSRKVRLPIPMFSMNKIKTIEEIFDWCKIKDISIDEEVVITPKFDGLSLCVNEVEQTAATRGNGYIGQNSNEHYKLINNKLNKGTNFTVTYGEAIMSKNNFLDKYSSEFANPRNLVAGVLNSKNINNILIDIDYIKYGGLIDGFSTKKEILDELNKNQEIKVSYYISKISDLYENKFIDLFKEWSVDYEIDGLIIEINSLKLQEKLGRETSTNNPVFARAFKHESFEQSIETEITKIDWIISKNGLLKPIARLKPVRLDGVTISNVTCNNARFVKDMGLGSGSTVKIVRSGMVIPKIIKVIKSVDFVMPNIGVEIDWTESGIELQTLVETDDQKLKKNIAFFQILEADYVSEGIVTQLWDAGYKTIESILNLKQSDLEKIDRFGKRKSQIVYNSIQKCISNVELSKLQHATGMFKGLGSKKLALLEDFTSKPTVDQVMEIEGFAEILAKSYVDSYDDFFNFIKGLPITIAKKVETQKVGSDLEGQTFVFTGVRKANLEEVIESRGGKIGSGVSKTTTHLVMKVKGSGSSKEKKALDLGVTILTVDELENLLK
jgi:DNA ligase (NAD+)